MNTTCPECGNDEAICIVEGSSLVFKCLCCGWSVATSWTDPINEDETTYVIKLLPRNSATKPVLSAIAKVMETNFLGAKKALDSEVGLNLFEGGAVEIRARAEALRSAGVYFEIIPEYPWSI